jgi:glyoxylase-like metal-dependent hydrolase (beta-lactamase superfamily II)
MRLGQKVYFYEGDYVDKKRKNYLDYYKGMASSNFMLITGARQVLIDSGCPEGPHRQRIHKELLADGIDLDATSRVIFSHAHPDHILMAKELSKRKPLEFSIHRDNEALIRHEYFLFESVFNLPEYVRREIIPFPDWMAKAYMKMIGMTFGYLRVKDFFSDGDIVHHDPEIIAVGMPAHSPGHVGFYFPAEKIFYSADLFDFRCVDGADVNVGCSSYEKALADIEKAKSLDIEILVPGHGMLIVGKDRIRETLDKVAEATRRYAQDIIEHLRVGQENAVSITELQRLVFPDEISYNAFSRRIITFNILDFLIKEGKVCCVYKQSMVRRKRALWFLPSLN